MIDETTLTQLIAKEEADAARHDAEGVCGRCTRLGVSGTPGVAVRAPCAPRQMSLERARRLRELHAHL